jgi:5'-AMP-activated protein kinase, catalytic alpha subunit
MISEDQEPGANSKKIVMLRTLGKGSFGKVKEALHPLSGEKIAIKILEKSQISASGDEVRVQREIAILQKANHPHVVQVYEIVETSRYYFFLMELCSGGDLASYIEKSKRLFTITTGSMKLKYDEYSFK